MAFYRSVLAAVAAVAIASPVFAADDAANPASAANAPAQAMQTSDTSSTAQPAAAQTTTADASAAASTTVNLNKASAKDLMKVKGINASKARAIVAYRKKHGDFKTVDTLAKVKGFTKLKDADLKTIETQVSVD